MWLPPCRQISRSKVLVSTETLAERSGGVVIGFLGSWGVRFCIDCQGAAVDVGCHDVTFSVWFLGSGDVEAKSRKMDVQVASVFVAPVNDYFAVARSNQGASHRDARVVVGRHCDSDACA
jgi:hypothetical protein